MSKRGTRKGADLTADDLRPPAGGERRRGPRIGCEKDVAILPTRPDGEWGFFVVRMFDCSSHGIGIFTEKPIPAGDQFMIRVKLDLIRLVVYTVRHCDAAGRGHYKVGAELTRVVGMDAGHQTADFLKALLTSEHPTQPEPSENQKAR